MANNLVQPEPINPKKVFDDLMKRCKQAQRWEIRCIVDEAWMGVAPFDMAIKDGIFYCYPIASSLKDAYVMVSDRLPVVTFLDYKDGDGS